MATMTFTPDNLQAVSSALFSAGGTNQVVSMLEGAGSTQLNPAPSSPTGQTTTFGWMTAPFDPGVTEWPAGTYTVVLNQNGNTIYGVFTKIEILQLDRTGTTVKSTVGSINLNQGTSNAQHVWNIAGVDTIVDRGDILAVRFSMHGNGGFATINYTMGSGGGSYVQTPIPEPTTYSHAVQNLKPRLFYRLDDAAAPIVDSSVYNQNGTLSTGANVTMNVAGLLGDGSGDGALKFNATDATSYVTLPTLSSTTGWTISCLLKVISEASAGSLLVGINGLAIYHANYNGSLFSVGIAQYTSSNGSGLSGSSVGGHLNVGTVYHLVLAIAANGNFTLYVNGAAVGSGGGYPTTAVPGYIFSPTGEDIPSVIDEVAIYNTTLTQSQVTALYDASIPGQVFTQSLTAALSFVGGVGTHAAKALAAAVASSGAFPKALATAFSAGVRFATGLMRVPTYILRFAGGLPLVGAIVKRTFRNPNASLAPASAWGKLPTKVFVAAAVSFVGALARMVLAPLHAALQNIGGAVQGTPGGNPTFFRTAFDVVLSITGAFNRQKADAVILHFDGLVVDTVTQAFEIDDQ